MSLSLRPTPSSAAQRGAAVIQPAYFTSSLFVESLRADIKQLGSSYSQQYRLEFLTDNVDNVTASGSSPGTHGPFALFKELWIEQGWQWLHLKVLEARARETFVSVVLRAFLEFATQSQEIIMRIVGIFGLYTFYTSQPRSSVPKVHIVDGIPIPIDSLESLFELVSSLDSFYGLLKPYVIYALKSLRPMFLILPPLASRAQKPPNLPREIVASGSDIGDTDGQRKAGRPSKTQKAQKVRNAVLELDRLVELTGTPIRSGQDSSQIVSGPYGRADVQAHEARRPFASLDAYLAKKAEMMSDLKDADKKVLDMTGRRVVDRLKGMDMFEAGSMQAGLDGVERLERVLMSEHSLLSLTD